MVKQELSKRIEEAEVIVGPRLPFYTLTVAYQSVTSLFPCGVSQLSAWIWVTGLGVRNRKSETLNMVTVSVTWV